MCKEPKTTFRLTGNSINQGCTNTGHRGTWEIAFCVMALNIHEPSVEIASCHSSGI